jgi:hypothetical protein
MKDIRVIALTTGSTSFIALVRVVIIVCIPCSSSFLLILPETASLLSILFVFFAHHLSRFIYPAPFVIPSFSKPPSLAGGMSLKAELDIWASALQAYDEQDFQKSLALFSVRELLSIIIHSYSIHSSASPIPLRFSLTWVSSTPLLESTRLR